MGCQYYEPTAEGAKTFTVAMPRYTFGRGCLGEVGKRALGLGMKRVALFTDSFLKTTAYFAIVEAALEAQGVQVDVFSDIRIEPDDPTIENAAKFLRQGKFDGVISLGGGSVMDTAKAAMIYALYPAAFTDYFAAPIGAGKPVPGPLLPHLACPTTSGTGSECTSVSVLRINSLNTKFVIGSPYLLPDEALVDPSVCDSLPGNVVASTGFDLLCHALECYTARAYTRWNEVSEPLARTMLQGANPWSDMSARKALEIAGEYLVRGVADSSDSEARDSLMWGASLAGMAFGNSGTHLAHAMSYGVTHLMNDITTDGYSIESPFIPHGISVIVSAPSIFKFLAEGAPVRHLEAAAFLGASADDATESEAGPVLAERLIELMIKTNMPNGLSGVGFGEKDCNALAQSSYRQTRAINNAPKVANQTDIENIYASAISYW